MVGRVEKWDDRKLWEDKKDFNFSHFCLIENGKVDGRKNIPLLKNDAQLKQKSKKQAKKKKKAITQIY